MRNFKDIILEKLKISKNYGYTLRNFIEWYINEEPGCPLSVNDVRILDFNRSPKETWTMFVGSSVKISQFLMKHLDDEIKITEDISKDVKEITYSFYIDDILFVVLAYYNEHAKYPTFFDQYVDE